MKCIVCGVSLEEGTQYAGHMIVQHDYPVTWWDRQKPRKVLCHDYAG